MSHWDFCSFVMSHQSSLNLTIDSCCCHDHCDKPSSLAAFGLSECLPESCYSFCYFSFTKQSANQYRGSFDWLMCLWLLELQREVREERCKLHLLETTNVSSCEKLVSKLHIKHRKKVKYGTLNLTTLI